MFVLVAATDSIVYIHQTVHLLCISIKGNNYGMIVNFVDANMILSHHMKGQIDTKKFNLYLTIQKQLEKSGFKHKPRHLENEVPKGQKKSWLRLMKNTNSPHRTYIKAMQTNNRSKRGKIVPPPRCAQSILISQCTCVAN